MKALKAATLAVIIALSGCSDRPPFEPEVKAFDLTYTRSNNVEGLCYITPILTANKDAILESVEIAEYGNIIYRNTARAYWGRDTVKASDVLHGRRMRLYAAGSGMIWVWYKETEQSKRLLRLTSLRCI